MQHFLFLFRYGSSYNSVLDEENADESNQSSPYENEEGAGTSRQPEKEASTTDSSLDCAQRSRPVEQIMISSPSTVADEDECSPELSSSIYDFR